MNFKSIKNLILEHFNKLDVASLKVIKQDLENTINKRESDIYCAIQDKDIDFFKQSLPYVNNQASNLVIELIKNSAYYKNLQQEDIPFLKTLFQSKYYQNIDPLIKTQFLLDLISHSLENPKLFYSYKEANVYSEKELKHVLDFKMKRGELHKVHLDLYIHFLKEYNLTINTDELTNIISRDNLKILSELFKQGLLDYVKVDEDYQDTFISIALNNRALHNCQYLLKLFPREITLDYFADTEGLNNLSLAKNGLFYDYILNTFPITPLFVEKFTMELYKNLLKQQDQYTLSEFIFFIYSKKDKILIKELNETINSIGSSEQIDTIKKVLLNINLQKDLETKDIIKKQKI